MELIVKEIIHMVRDCEDKKTFREADRIKNERQCYQDIKNLVEPFMGREKGVRK